MNKGVVTWKAITDIYNSYPILITILVFGFLMITEFFIKKLLFLKNAFNITYLIEIDRRYLV